jgi:organic hydroperoxide reductase OsmC/OhrA
MSATSSYFTRVIWKGEHWGHVSMGNGPEMDFSAPPDAHGHAGVYTPEDGFVAALNTCIMLMFLWACERFKLQLKKYECSAEGIKKVELDHTESFIQVILRPTIVISANNEPAEAVFQRVHKALAAAQKYSLVANSIKSPLILEPYIEIVE